MKYNYNKLRGRIREMYGTQEKFAEAVQISKTSISNKLNNITDFSQSEILKSAELLNIKTEEIGEYFFYYKS